MVPDRLQQTLVRQIADPARRHHRSVVVVARDPVLVGRQPLRVPVSAMHAVQDQQFLPIRPLRRDRRDVLRVERPIGQIVGDIGTDGASHAGFQRRPCAGFDLHARRDIGSAAARIQVGREASARRRRPRPGRHRTRPSSRRSTLTRRRSVSRERSRRTPGRVPRTAPPSSCSIGHPRWSGPGHPRSPGRRGGRRRRCLRRTAGSVRRPWRARSRP